MCMTSSCCDHVGCLAAKGVQVQTGLGVVKVKLDLPALLIPPGDLRGVVDVAVAQGGDDLQLLGAHAGSGARHFDRSHIQCLRQGMRAAPCADPSSLATDESKRPSTGMRRKPQPGYCCEAYA